jgi:MoxR-like ATPase
MSDYATAMAALRDARDALNVADIDTAARALAAHDAAVRDACTGATPLAVSEMEHLAAAQRALLAELQQVQQGVARELSQSRRGSAAARSYLGNAGG